MVIKDYLSQLEREGNLRKLPLAMRPGMLDFTSNDYLGVASRKDFTEEFLSSCNNFLFSSSSSRLLSSRQEEYGELEQMIKHEYGREALIFNSGYHANTGIIPALAADGKTLIISDKLVHASIIDGIILSRSDYRRFAHNDLRALRRIVEKNHSNYERLIVIAESVYSMDGDSPDLEELLALKREFPKIILYLDEAHALGLKGPKGLGMAQSTSAPKEWDIIVNPLGKAAASMGAFVVCNEEMKGFLVNKARSLIFSTALPPLQIAWTSFVLKKIFRMDSEREHLEKISERFSEILATYSPSHKKLYSHIQPLIIGDSKKTIRLAEYLDYKGIRVLPIRKPTVAAGTERLRFSLTAAMTEEDMTRVAEIFKNLPDASEIYN